MNNQTFTFNGSVRARQMVVGNDNIVHGSAAGEPVDDHPGPVFGIVTALPEEFTAVLALLDDEGEVETVAGDRAHYVRGTLPSHDAGRCHEVVVTLLGDTGNAAAAEACANLIRSFPSVGVVVMCGIACGVPDPARPERHVGLGDIVVATWGIADYDHVVETDGGRRPRQPFPLPSPMLARSAKHLAAGELRGARPWEKWIEQAVAAVPDFARPGPRPAPFPKVHHGLIGSADRSLRSARVRDELAAADRLMAFEMEGKGIGSAGFAGGLEWFVVRGISDYGDASTGLLWRGYASVVAAAYVRALLAECAPMGVRGGHPEATGPRGR